MKICRSCGRTYDDSWEKCLFCGEALTGAVPEGVKSSMDIERDKFPGNKFLIVLYSLLLMVLTPLIIIVIYTAYYQVMDVDSDKHERKQLKESIVFDKEAEDDEKDRKKKW